MIPTHRALYYIVVASLVSFLAAWNLATPCHADVTPISPYSTIEHLATYLTGKPTTIACRAAKDMDGDEGYVNFDENGKAIPEIFLANHVCTGINRLLRGQVTAPVLQGDDLETLLHEATHVRLNMRDEGMTECIAIHQVKGAARTLGYAGTTLRALVNGAWSLHYSLPSNYLKVC